MTKKQVAKKINKLIDDYTKTLCRDVNAVLVEADMIYGDDIRPPIKRTKNLDRNADLLILDGKFDTDTEINDYLHTVSELNNQ